MLSNSRMKIVQRGLLASMTHLSPTCIGVSHNDEREEGLHEGEGHCQLPNHNAGHAQCTCTVKRSIAALENYNIVKMVCAYIFFIFYLQQRHHLKGNK